MYFLTAILIILLSLPLFILALGLAGIPGLFILLFFVLIITYPIVSFLFFLGPNNITIIIVAAIAAWFLLRLAKIRKSKEKPKNPKDVIIDQEDD